MVTESNFILKLHIKVKFTKFTESTVRHWISRVDEVLVVRSRKCVAVIMVERVQHWCTGAATPTPWSLLQPAPALARTSPQSPPHGPGHVTPFPPIRSQNRHSWPMGGQYGPAPGSPSPLPRHIAICLSSQIIAMCQSVSWTKQSPRHRQPEKNIWRE